MKTYLKTKWVDGETPVNAANLNKLENAVQELSETAISPSDLDVKENGGLKKTLNDGKVILELSEHFLQEFENLKSEANSLKEQISQLKADLEDLKTKNL